MKIINILNKIYEDVSLDDENIKPLDELVNTLTELYEKIRIDDVKIEKILKDLYRVLEGAKMGDNNIETLENFLLLKFILHEKETLHKWLSVKPNTEVPDELQYEDVLFSIHPRELRDLLIEENELIDKMSDIYFHTFIRKDSHRRDFIIEIIKTMLPSLVLGFEPHKMVFIEDHLFDIEENWSIYGAGENGAMWPTWMDFTYGYLCYAERVIREHLKLFLYTLLIEDNLFISRERNLEKGDKMKIVISKKDGEEKELYEMIVKSLEYIKVLNSKEELDSLQWGDIINILKNIKNKKEEKRKVHREKCAKKLREAINRYFDLDLRHSIAHGKVKMIKEGGEIYIKYIKGGKEHQISLKEFWKKYNKMREFAFILTASIVVGVGKYFFNKEIITDN